MPGPGGPGGGGPGRGPGGGPGMGGMGPGRMGPPPHHHMHGWGRGWRFGGCCLPGCLLYMLGAGGVIALIVTGICMLF